MEIDFVYDYKVTQRVQKQTVNLQENQAISARKIKEVFQKRKKKKSTQTARWANSNTNLVHVPCKTHVIELWVSKIWLEEDEFYVFARD